MHPHFADVFLNKIGPPTLHVSLSCADSRDLSDPRDPSWAPLEPSSLCDTLIRATQRSQELRRRRFATPTWTDALMLCFRHSPFHSFSQTRMG